MARISGNRIRQAREASGLTRTQLAAIIERSEQTVISYELGRVIPPTPMIERVASVLGVHPGDLFADDLEQTNV